MKPTLMRLLPLAALLAVLMVAQAQTVAAQDVVVVIKPYGAALRVAPSSDAAIYEVASCGESLTVTGSSSGWYQVYSRGRYLWVGGARVANAYAPPRFNCSDGFTFQPNEEVVVRVPSGCLSLRYSPSRQAAYDQCVYPGHHYLITNGPVEVAGEDWFEVWSPDTGSGWSLAQYLYPWWW